MNFFTFPYRLQLTPYSCTAAVYAACVRKYTGRRISHFQAMRKLGLDRDGTSFFVLREELRKARMQVVSCAKRRLAIDAQLRRGRVVVVSDTRTYKNPHAAVIVGLCGSKYVIADPARLVRICNADDYVKRVSACFAVGKRAL